MKMLKTLPQEKVRRLRQSLPNHPLLEACQVAFTPRIALMDGLMVEAEDVFCVVAEVFDSLLLEDHPTLEFVENMWTNLVINIRRQWQSDASEKDRMLVATSVFYIVRDTLVHHWHSRYCDEWYDILSMVIEKRKKQCDLDEEQELLKRLDQCAAGLNDWINDYIASEELLTEKMSAILDGKEFTIPRGKSGRKPKDLQIIVSTFDYLPLLNDRAARLQAFYQSLKGKYIDKKTDLQNFVDIFQNTSTSRKIVWIREIKLLKYLIDKLDKLGYISCPQGYTKWQIVCAHFQLRVKQKHTNDNITNDSYEIIDLIPTQFTKGGKVPETYDELDRIIRILDPKTKYEESLQDYLDYQQEHDEKMDVKDALAHGLNTDLHV
jgi:hypothetical protein